DRGYTQALAHAVVIYDMGTLAVDDGQTFSLSIQTLAIALVLGLIVFFFLYKIVIYPVVGLNRKLSTALRDGHGNIESEYQFPELTELAQTIHGALSRGGGSMFEGPSNYEHERSSEAAGLTTLIGFPAIAVRCSDLQVVSINPQFQEQIAKTTDWSNLSLENV